MSGRTTFQSSPSCGRAVILMSVEHCLWLGFFSIETFFMSYWILGVHQSAILHYKSYIYYTHLFAIKDINSQLTIPLFCMLCLWGPLVWVRFGPDPHRTPVSHSPRATEPRVGVNWSSVAQGSGCSDMEGHTGFVASCEQMNSHSQGSITQGGTLYSSAHCQTCIDF